MKFHSLVIVAYIFVTTGAQADTVHLKNGRSVEGILEDATDSEVVLRVEGGTVRFSQGEIARVERSDAQTNESIGRKWEQAYAERIKRHPADEAAYARRQIERERLITEETARRRALQDAAPQEVKVLAKDRQILVNVLLNGKVRTHLVLDSGASSVVLSKRVASELGIDPSSLKKTVTQVADGRTVEVGVTQLESVTLQDMQIEGPGSEESPGVSADRVDAVVLMQDMEDLEDGKTAKPMPDGLLGMSFLKNYKFNADYQNQKLILEPVPQDAPVGQHE